MIIACRQQAAKQPAACRCYHVVMGRTLRRGGVMLSGKAREGESGVLYLLRCRLRGQKTCYLSGHACEDWTCSISKLLRNQSAECSLPPRRTRVASCRACSGWHTRERTWRILNALCSSASLPIAQTLVCLPYHITPNIQLPQAMVAALPLTSVWYSRRIGTWPQHALTCYLLPSLDS